MVHIFEGFELNWRQQQNDHLLHQPSLSWSGPPSHSTTTTAPLRHHPPRPHGLSLGTYNIRNGRGFGLAQDIRAVHLGIFNVMLLNNTKFTRDEYFRYGIGYNMVCSLSVTTATSGM